MRTFAVSIAVWALAGSVSAEAPSLTLTVGAATDYVFRGVSQTQGGPEYFASAELAQGGFYGGLATENVDFPGDPYTRWEVDLYGGWRAAVSGWSVDAGAALYAYPDAPAGAAYDYVETKLTAARAFGSATLGGGLYYAPEYFGGTGPAGYAEINAAYALTPALSVSGAAGFQDVSYDGDYATWNVGASWAATDRIAFDLRYSDTDRHAYGEIYEDRLAAVVKATF